MALAIDLLTEIIDADEVVGYLGSTEPGGQPCATFNARNSRGLRRIPVYPILHEGGGHVRVVELGAFISGYLRRTVNAASIADVRNEYFSDDVPKPL